MKKEKAIAMVLTFALAGAVLTGCGESQPPLQDAQQRISISIPEESSPDSAAEKTGTEAAAKPEAGIDEADQTVTGTDAADQAATGADTANKPTDEADVPDEAAAGTDTADKAAAGADSADTAGQASEKYEDNFAVDSTAAKEFAEKVKDAVAQKDLEALAELTSFPVYVGLPNVSAVKTKEDFLNLGAEAVFTEKLLESIEKADIENFQPSMAGFSISGGGTANINFGVVDGVLAVTGINY